MSRQYLDVPYRSKDAAKALGARFDGAVKRWYVEAGVDLVAFSAWLPAGTTPGASSSMGMALTDTATTGMAIVKKGIPLSRLLNGVAAAVAQAFATGLWSRSTKPVCATGMSTWSFRSATAPANRSPEHGP